MKSFSGKKIHSGFLLFVFLTVSILHANGQSTDTAVRIIPDGKLEWKYYTGQTDKNSGYWANTNCGVYYTFSIVPSFNDTAKILIHSWAALKNNSWVLPDKKSNELLEHEQCHFDFAVLCSLEFEKAVRSAIFFKINYSQEIDSIFKATLNKYKQMEIQYDTETKHMFNKIKQAEWEERLKAMLKELQ